MENNLKKVLIITSSFPPEGGGGVRRVLGYARYLSDYGWAPIILTPYKKAPLLPDGVEGRRWRGSGTVYYVPWLDIRGAINTLERFLPELRPGPERTFSSYLSANKTGLYPWLRSWLLVPDEYVTWLRPAAKKAGEVISRFHPKAMVTVGPSHVSHLVGLRVSRCNDLPWIADFKDPWADNPFIGYPSILHRRLNLRLEKKVLGACSMAITVSPSIRSGLERIHPGLRAEVLPNGFDPASFRKTGAGAEKGLPLRIIHAGLLYGSRTPFPFLEALKLLKARGVSPAELQATFLGAASGQTMAAVKREGLEEYVEVQGHVPHEKAVDTILAHDICLLLPGPGKGTITGKVFEYLAAGKPILCIGGRGGDLEGLLWETTGKRPFEINDPEGISLAVTEWIKEKGSKGTITGNVNRKRLQAYDRSVLTGRLAKWLDQLTT